MSPYKIITLIFLSQTLCASEKECELTVLVKDFFKAILGKSSDTLCTKLSTLYVMFATVHGNIEDENTKEKSPGMEDEDENY